MLNSPPDPESKEQLQDILLYIQSSASPEIKIIILGPVPGPGLSPVPDPGGPSQKWILLPHPESETQSPY